MNSKRLICMLMAWATLLIAVPSWGQSKADRSRLPVQQALAGHWYRKDRDRHDYFELTNTSPVGVKSSWYNAAGAVSPTIQSTFYRVDGKENTLILRDKSPDGSVHFTKYIFSPDRNTMVMQALRDDLTPSPYLDPYNFVYIDSKTRSPVR